jgi:hypothetical protein
MSCVFYLFVFYLLIFAIKAHFETGDCVVLSRLTKSNSQITIFCKP